MKELTERQQQILQFISDYTEENSFPPTVRETAEHFSVSLKAIQDHFTALTKKGYLLKDEKRSRSLKVLGNVTKKANKGYKIPVLGSVAAGKPIFCEEDYENTIYLSEPFVRPGNSYFALHVKGSSMINAGINDGDIAIIKQQSTANDGDIVVAIIDDSVTLKRFFKEATRIRLQAENPDFNPIYSQDVKVLGKLSHIIREY
ncbi:MAG: transcriptional repressor LexA [Treponemataceae bacterium]|jgi:repressor LexA|nr:transcriptional repressor LexA [Spirochaetaceae bacterium]MEE0879790.1 transcriptional repressor LexA [Treponemataceae bacterium]